MNPAMNRPRPRRRPDWDLLETRLHPAVTGAASLVPAVQRTDSYAVQRHAADRASVASGQDGIVFLGDSITDYFATGAGASIWSSQIAPLGVADFGVAGDTAENLLWRVQDGEMAGHPRLVVLNIGTNDLGNGDSVNYTVAAIQAVVEEIQTISPDTQIELMGLFPRGATASDPLRTEIAQVNTQLAKWAPLVGASFLNIDAQLIAADGTISADFVSDNVHPNAAGYQVWDNAIQSLLQETYRSESSSMTVVASDGGVAGITKDGAVWYNGPGLPSGTNTGQVQWTRLGTLGGVDSLVASSNLAGHQELFAERTDDSIWVYDYTAGTWSSTGGYLVPGSMVADADGISGIAGGGSVFHFTAEQGWSEVGTLMGVDTLVTSRNLSGQEELFAQRADGAIWVYRWRLGVWINTGDVLDAGSMIADSNGISGVYGPGYVFHYFDEYGWLRVGTIGNAVSLVDSISAAGQEELFAQLSDSSVWVFNFATSHWANTGESISPGTLTDVSGGVAGVAGGVVFRYADGHGWIQASSIQNFAAAALIDGVDSFGREVLYATAADGTLYELLTSVGDWVDEFGQFA